MAKKGDNCVKGYSCSLACISRSKACLDNVVQKGKPLVGFLQRVGTAAREEAISQTIGTAAGGTFVKANTIAAGSMAFKDSVLKGDMKATAQNLREMGKSLKEVITPPPKLSDVKDNEILKAVVGGSTEEFIARSVGASVTAATGNPLIGAALGRVTVAIGKHEIQRWQDRKEAGVTIKDDLKKAANKLQDLTQRIAKNDLPELGGDGSESFRQVLKTLQAKGNVGMNASERAFVLGLAKTTLGATGMPPALRDALAEVTASTAKAAKNEILDAIATLQQSTE